MSVNNFRPHVIVLPEDDANRQLINGFLMDPSLFHRRIRVLEPAGGWLRVLNQFTSDNVSGMDHYPERRLVLLIDFDGRQERLADVKNRIPARLTNRVFVLGVWTEPEALRNAGLGSYETIGRALASDCREGTTDLWDHELLRHNAGEVSRLREFVQPFLFQPAP